MSNNRVIARNTLILYFRMFFTMLVSLYTTRVILQVLGVDDYGIYQTVGGLVAMLSFLNSSLSTSTSRFLTYALGINDSNKLSNTFSTLLTIHIILALLVFVFAETIGIWIVKDKLNLPPDRMNSALFAYHISVFTALITITQVPYNATIISHEKMDIYAFITIVDVILKLLIVYLLRLFNGDKLKLYSLMICILQVGISIFYRFYCVSRFKETRYRLVIDKGIFKDIASFSGWNLWSNTAIALNSQGMTLLVNMYFSPAVVAARSIANQVNMAANQFVQNFRTAANPQIVKQYAVGNYDESKYLLLSSTKYSYYLMMCICIPICFVAEDLLLLWLKDVPEYTVAFLQISVITSLSQVFDHSFYTALYAKGQIRENAILSPSILIASFIITYILYKNGYSPLVSAWGMLVSYCIIGLIVKPLLVVRITGYKYREIFTVLKSCFIVTISSLPLPIITYYKIEVLALNRISSMLLIVLITWISIICSIWFLGIDKQTKRMIVSYFHRLIK